MSMSPSNMPHVFNLVSLGGLSGTATGVGSTVVLPTGMNTLQVSLPTSATATIKVQNSVDGTTWFDVSSSTVATVGAAGGSFLGVIESDAPKWRANITAYTTATLALVAQVAMKLP